MVNEMAKPMIMGNWKMNNTLAESKELLRQLSVLLPKQTDVEVVICPPFTALCGLGECMPEGVALGAQNMHPAASGAFTGEISAAMLKEAGCRYVIIGHSERRHVLGESDELIAAKVSACMKATMVPVLCVGETLSQREQGVGAEVVKSQLIRGLAEVGSAEGELVIAYEPVWAIGSGKAASAVQAEEMLQVVKEVIASYPASIRAARLLYGGSVTPANIHEFSAREIIDGALVGGVSLKADQFAELVRVTSESTR